MSRSRKKTPVHNIASNGSKKSDKKLANRTFRRKEKEAIFNEEEPPEDVKEVSDIWGWDCDGWRYDNRLLDGDHDDFFRK